MCVTACAKAARCLDREEPAAAASCWQQERPSEETHTHAALNANLK